MISQLLYVKLSHKSIYIAVDSFGRSASQCNIVSISKSGSSKLINDFDSTTHKIKVAQ